jgi:hypothetical protein
MAHIFILCPLDGTAAILGVVYSGMLAVLKCLVQEKISDGNTEDESQVF